MLIHICPIAGDDNNDGSAGHPIKTVEGGLKSKALIQRCRAEEAWKWIAEIRKCITVAFAAVLFVFDFESFVILVAVLAFVKFFWWVIQ